MRDLASVLKDGEKGIRTEDAVARMRALATAPWSNYKGVGLDAITLASLVNPLGVKPRNLGKYGTGAQAKQARGYSRKDIMASLPSVK